MNYTSSVDIRPEWGVVEQIPFSSLSKLNFAVGKPEEVRPPSARQQGSRSAASAP